jgi:phenylpropionate dioxygenase-like ring-hydroxylating dioxygenase large terminal subunit
MVCRAARGNATSHTCVYHQWNYSSRGTLQGVPFRRGQKEMIGMPGDFDPKAHSLRPLRVESYRGLVFAAFSEEAAPLCDYIGEQMRPCARGKKLAPSCEAFSAPGARAVCGITARKADHRSRK